MVKKTPRRRRKERRRKQADRRASNPAQADTVQLHVAYSAEPDTPQEYVAEKNEPLYALPAPAPHVAADPSPLEVTVEITKPKRRWDDADDSWTQEVRRVYSEFDWQAYVAELKQNIKSIPEIGWYAASFEEIQPKKGRKHTRATALGNTIIAGCLAATLALTCYLVYDIGRRPLQYQSTASSVSDLEAPSLTSRLQQYQRPS